MNDRLDKKINMKKIGIIGGAGSMGTVVTEKFNALDYNTLISDPKANNGIELADLLDSCKIIYISVFPLEPISVILEAISARNDVSDFVIIENSSIKGKLKESFEKIDSLGGSVCATHPLCKADQPLKNQSVILIPIGSNSERAVAISRELYEYSKMKLHFMNSIDEHDQLMCILQLLPHLIFRAVSLVFSKLPANIDILEDIGTANFKLFNLCFWRVIVQNEELSATIISQLLEQEKGDEIYNLLMENLRKIKDSEIEPLSTEFQSFHNLPSFRTAYRDKMNMRTIVTLERLSNLERRSITIIARQNRVGLLREILKPFEELEISLNAIDSHIVSPNEVRFDIGYEGEDIDEKIPLLAEKIERLGHKLLT